MRRASLPSRSPADDLAARPDEGAVLAKATLRAAELLGVSGAELARVLGVSAASLSRTRSTGRPIDPDSTEGKLALLFLRMYRSLSSLLGDVSSCRAWFRAENAHLRGTPAELVRTIEGLVHVTEYLDAMRGKS